LPCILLTGATGYIASHTWLALQEAGFDVVGIDSLVNSSVKVLDRLETIGRRAPHFVQGDVRDAAALDRCFELARTRFGGIQAVVHFAALKAVGESVERPLDYFENNLGGLLSVCQAMKRHGVNNLVFSSSATVYGSPDTLPITEDAPLRVTNPMVRPS
jgi:UDP-glucose 4-epimerase